MHHCLFKVFLSSLENAFYFKKDKNRTNNYVRLESQIPQQIIDGQGNKEIFRHNVVNHRIMMICIFL